MLKSLKKKMKDQAGLTLIELLVVIVILGIIAAVAVPMVMSNKDDAAKNTNAQNLTVLQDAVNRYYTINDEYPDNLGVLVTAPATDGGPFLDKEPKLKGVDSCTDGSSFSYTKTAIAAAGSATAKKAGEVYAPTACLPTP
jgi:type IV pilus assembly protein PilA